MNIQKIKHLKEILPKNSGRDVQGHVSVRHQGGRQKRFYRIVDWRRDKDGVPARVVSIEYDPNRPARIALLQYTDGEKRYILAPEKLLVNDQLLSGATAEVKIGNALKLRNMPVGTFVHNVEIRPGKGAQLIRSAGGTAMVLAKEGDNVQLN